MSIFYVAGDLFRPGTNVPRNTTGDCPHRHRTPEAAERCIDRSNRALQRQIGGEGHYVDRQVIEVRDGERRVWSATDLEDAIDALALPIDDAAWQRDAYRGGDS